VRKDAALLGLVNRSLSCTGKPEALPIPKKYIRPLAFIQNLTPLSPPFLRGEARKIRLPPFSKGRDGEGFFIFLQEVYF
jgi:hypothetical protein